jgi:membrane protein DedA with SNARE-associated domain
MDFGVFGDSLNQFVDWVTSFGVLWIYALIVIASFIENIFPPFPGDTVTVIGAVLAARGDLSFTLVFFAAYLGGISSTMLIYRFGRTHGHQYFMTRDSKLFPKDKIIEFEGWLERWGSWLITGHRFIVGFRTLVSVSAGIARWPVWRMAFYGSLSFFIFNAALIGLTYLLVDNLGLLVKVISLYKTYFLIALALALAYYLFRRYRKRAEKAKDSS